MYANYLDIKYYYGPYYFTILIECDGCCVPRTVLSMLAQTRACVRARARIRILNENKNEQKQDIHAIVTARNEIASSHAPIRPTKFTYISIYSIYAWFSPTWAAAAATSAEMQLCPMEIKWQRKIHWNRRHLYSCAVVIVKGHYWFPIQWPMHNDQNQRMNFGCVFRSISYD